MKRIFTILFSAVIFMTFSENTFAQKQTSESGNLVFVKGGTFLSTSDTKNPNDYKQHRETVEDFYISKYEVTVALYKKVTGKNPTSARDGTDEMNRPVENISGYDCIDFLNALSRLEGFEECYSFKNGKWTCDFSKNGYRLPTLPEWEYAARGGSLSKGYKYSGSDKISEAGWYDENSGGHAHQVGLLKPNELGLYDMSGNVGERCWNPSYKGENPAHVGRGGCWIYYEGYCNPDYRFVTTENFKQDGLGLRLVRSKGKNMMASDITTETKIRDIISNPSLGDWGRLLFSASESYWSGDTLGDLQLTWYSHINPQKTVEIVRYVTECAENGEQVFFDIYSEEEKRTDPDKRNTGLFFFRGKPGAKTAICNAGGGFAYVGAMHDSFPHALELSKKGYNAFALIYRPGAQTACQDLARAIAFLHQNSSTLGIDMTGFSLWGGSAGARMAAWLGSLGTEYFGEQSYPRPAAVIMQYTGLGEVYGNEPPTYNCVGTNDGIASFKTMERRINAIKANGTDAQIEVFRGLGHGFGLGQGTVAEGWIDNAVKFWEKQNEQLKCVSPEYAHGE